MIKHGLPILSLSLLVLSACGNRREGEQKPTLLSHAMSITDNEDKGVKEILDFYGGECKYSVGSSDLGEGRKKYFVLEMSKSKAIEKYTNAVEMPASNIAYLFFHNLKEEKNNYDEIQTIIHFDDNSKMDFKFPKKDLELVDAKMSTVQKFVTLLKNKDFEQIKLMLVVDTSFLRYNKNEVVANLAKVEPQLGTIQKFLPYGFRLRKLDNGKEFLHISGVLLRDKQSNEFSVDLDPVAKRDEVIAVNYKL